MSAGQGLAGGQRASMLVRVPPDAYDELVKIQQEAYIENGGRITLGAIIARLLADRKPVRP